MAEIKIPVQINLPDDWIEQIVERLKNDPDAEWVEVVRCKDCKWHGYNECFHKLGLIAAFDNNYCSYAERREE